MNTFFRNLLSLNLLCITLFFTACSKDDDGTNNIDNLATGPIELPVLRQGVNDLFISYSTKFNGQDVTTYSMAVSYTHLDVYKRQADPRPDYYKKLPSSIFNVYDKSRCV